jgi:hypothetical protein
MITARLCGLLELFTTIAAEASSPAHPGHSFIAQRYTANLATLAGHLREAVEAGDITPLSPAQIAIEVRLFTAVMDGIGLQSLLNPGNRHTRQRLGLCRTSHRCLGGR